MLCDFELSEGAREYAEGKFCADVAGCRRRALARYRELCRLVIEVIGGIKQVELIAELPALPKKMKPDTLHELALVLLSTKEEK